MGRPNPGRHDRIGSLVVETSWAPRGSERCKIVTNPPCCRPVCLMRVSFGQRSQRFHMQWTGGPHWKGDGITTRPRPGQLHGRGPRRQRGGGRAAHGPGRRRRRPPGLLPRDDADRLPGRGPRPAPVVSCRLPRGAGEAGRGSRGGRARRHRRHRGLRRRRRPAPRRLRLPARGRGRRPVQQAPPAELRGLRRAPLLRARDLADRRPAPRCRHRTDGLRGRLAGGRPVHRRRRGRRRDRGQHQRLPVRAEQGRHPAATPAAARR